MNYTYTQLKTTDIEKYRQLMKLFGEVFEDRENYHQNLPSDAYVENYLRDKSHVILVVQMGEEVVGGLAAYVLEKFEQERKEIFVYDLAIAGDHQRKGLATGLFNQLKEYAQARNINQMFVEAEAVDEGAIEFYRSLKAEELIAHHFTINIPHSKNEDNG